MGKRIRKHDIIRLLTTKFLTINTRTLIFNPYLKCSLTFHINFVLLQSKFGVHNKTEYG